MSCQSRRTSRRRRLVDIERQRDAQPRGAFRNRRRTDRPNIETLRCIRRPAHAPPYRRRSPEGSASRGLRYRATGAVRSSQTAIRCASVPAAQVRPRRFQCCAHARRDQRRGRRGINERPRAIDQKVAKRFGARISPPNVPSALPQVCSVMTLSRPSNAAAEPPPLGRSTPVAWASSTRNPSWRSANGQLDQRRTVAVHAVEAFDRHPGPPRAAGPAPSRDRGIKRIDIVMRTPTDSRDRTNALMDAGMDQLVMHDEIAALRQRREDREIGDIAAAEIERRFGAERRLPLRASSASCSG